MAALDTPQTPAALQVWAWQVVSAPQSAAVMQPTQAPWPLHIRLVPQLVPLVRFGFVGTPAVHTSPVHALPSTGLSASSLIVIGAPAMQTLRLQSPGVWLGTAVPSAVLAMPQPPPMQVRW